MSWITLRLSLLPPLPPPLFPSYCLNHFRLIHDEVIKWKHFPHYWPFVQGIHESPVNSPHKVQCCGALMFSLISASTKGWVNKRDAGDFRHHHAHYDITEMHFWLFINDVLILRITGKIKMPIFFFFFFKRYLSLIWVWKWLIWDYSYCCNIELTHLPLVLHICTNESGWHWFR